MAAMRFVRVRDESEAIALKTDSSTADLMAFWSDQDLINILRLYVGRRVQVDFLSRLRFPSSRVQIRGTLLEATSDQRKMYVRVRRHATVVFFPRVRAQRHTARGRDRFLHLIRKRREQLIK